MDSNARLVEYLLFKAVLSNYESLRGDSLDGVSRVWGLRVGGHVVEEWLFDGGY